MVVIAVHRQAIAADEVAVAAITVFLLGTYFFGQDSGFQTAVVRDMMNVGV